MSDLNGAAVETQEKVIAEGAAHDAAQEAQMGAVEAQAETVDGTETGERGALVKEAQRLLHKVITYFQKANGAFVYNRILSAEWGWEYVKFRRFTMNHKREKVIQALSGRLAEISDSEADSNGNHLIQCYWAVKLLCGKADHRDFGKESGQDGVDWRLLSWGKLYAMMGLVTRNDADETYSVRPGIKEEEAKALFVWACGTMTERPSLSNVRERVEQLVNPERAAEKAKAKAEKAKDSADKGASKDETPATVEGADKPKDEAPATVESGPEQSEPENAKECVQDNLLAKAREIGKRGAVKDVAEMAAEIVRGCDKPDDVLCEMLRMLAASGELSKRGKRACNTAILVLTRKEGKGKARESEAAQESAADSAAQEAESAETAVSAA